MLLSWVKSRLLYSLLIYLISTTLTQIIFYLNQINYRSALKNTATMKGFIDFWCLISLTEITSQIVQLHSPVNDSARPTLAHCSQVFRTCPCCCINKGSLQPFFEDPL